jgi:hypothetical protein
VERPSQRPRALVLVDVQGQSKHVLRRLGGQVLQTARPSLSSDTRLGAFGGLLVNEPRTFGGPGR